MKNDPVILLTEDDEGHATLIKNNLNRYGNKFEFIHHKDGQETLDFLFCRGEGPHRKIKTPYIVLLDIRMPKVDGIETLTQIKANPILRKIPIIMLTTTDDPLEIERCHKLGCYSYVIKPVDYEKFIDIIKRMSKTLGEIDIPEITEPCGGVV